eukprot:4800453-Pyramimonas_sp.AAC.1
MALHGARRASRASSPKNIMRLGLATSQPRPVPEQEAWATCLTSSMEGASTWPRSLGHLTVSIPSPWSQSS